MSAAAVEPFYQIVHRAFMRFALCAHLISKRKLSRTLPSNIKVCSMQPSQKNIIIIRKQCVNWLEISSGLKQNEKKNLQWYTRVTAAVLREMFHFKVLSSSKRMLLLCVWSRECSVSVRNGRKVRETFSSIVNSVVGRPNKTYFRWKNNYKL